MNKLRFYIFHVEGGNLWGLTAETLREALLGLDMDKRTAGLKRELSYEVPVTEKRELVNLSVPSKDR